jgi:hypothetical protein
MLKPAERKRVNTTKHTGVYQTLLLAGLMLAIGGAHAATPYKVCPLQGHSYRCDGQ